MSYICMSHLDKPPRNDMEWILLSDSNIHFILNTYRFNFCVWGSGDFFSLFFFFFFVIILSMFMIHNILNDFLMFFVGPTMTTIAFNSQSTTTSPVVWKFPFSDYTTFISFLQWVNWSCNNNNNKMCEGVLAWRDYQTRQSQGLV